MRTIVHLFFLLICVLRFHAQPESYPKREKQDSIKTAEKQLLAIEVQTKYGVGKSTGEHGNNETQYRFPSLDLFYRRQFHTAKKVRAIQAEVAFSNGHYYEPGGGLGSYYLTEGDFNIYKIQAGFAGLRKFGKNKGFRFGWGINFAYNVAAGNLDVTSSGLDIKTMSWVTEYSKVDANQYCRHFSSAFNLEAMQRFRLQGNKLFFSGFKAFIETGEMLDEGPNYGLTFFCAINI